MDDEVQDQQDRQAEDEHVHQLQQQLTNEIDKMVLGEEEKVLQTYTVAAKEVRAEADKWKPAIKEEIDNLLSTNTIIKMSKEEVASSESSGMTLEKFLASWWLLGRHHLEEDEPG